MNPFYTSIIAFLFVTISPAHATENNYKIDVFFWHESSNDYSAFKGIKDGFKTAGINCEFKVYKAQGKEDVANNLIRKIAAEKPDLVYAMGTGAAIRLMKVIKETPIVFTAVTNPVQSGITPDWNTSGRNLAGNSNWIPTDEVIESFKDIVPGLKNLGVMYDPDNSVSSMEVREARKIEEKLGVKLVTVEVKSVEELISGTSQLIRQKVEAVWIPIDILIYKNVSAIRTITDLVGMPLVSSSNRGIQDGAIYGIVVDYYSLGKRSVSIALKILEQNIPPQDIPIGTMSSHRHIINLKVADKINFDIPLSVLANADEIYK